VTTTELSPVLPPVVTQEPLLELRNITAGYGRVTVLRDVSISVPAGSVVALLGANGAGKTTLLRAASGLLSPTKGEIFVKGRKVGRSRPAKRAQSGLCLVPEGRGVFKELSVRENLRIFRPSWVKRDHTEAVVEAFPILGKRMSQIAGSLSGGEQQMLALSRAYVAEPEVVLLDEVSMGLAPIVIDQIFVSLKTLAASGVSLLLVEQYVDRALDIADTVVLLDRGTVSFTGSPSELDHDALMRNYLGADIADRDAIS
jgi:branched-chain amino acid transport system ATP-binding protein